MLEDAEISKNPKVAKGYESSLLWRKSLKLRRKFQILRRRKIDRTSKILHRNFEFSNTTAELQTLHRKSWILDQSCEYYEYYARALKTDSSEASLRIFSVRTLKYYVLDYASYVYVLFSRPNSRILHRTFKSYVGRDG